MIDGTPRHLTRRDILKLTIAGLGGAAIAALESNPLVAAAQKMMEIREGGHNSETYSHLEVFASNLDHFMDGHRKTVCILDTQTGGAALATGQPQIRDITGDGLGEIVIDKQDAYIATGAGINGSNLDPAYSYDEAFVKGKLPNEGGTYKKVIIPSIAIRPELLATQNPSEESYQAEINMIGNTLARIKNDPNIAVDEKNGSFIGQAELWVSKGSKDGNDTAAILYYIRGMNLQTNKTVLYCVGGTITEQVTLAGSGIQNIDTRTLKVQALVAPVKTNIMPIASTPTLEAITYDENDLLPVYSVPFAEKVFGSNGPKVTGSLDTDKTASPINKVDMAPADAAKLMLMIMYESWKIQNKGTVVTLEKYAEMVKEVQSGTRNPLEIGVFMHGNKLFDNEPYKTADGKINTKAQKPMLVIPWFTGTVSETTVERDGITYEVKPTNQINIACVRTDRATNLTSTSKSYEMGAGTNVSSDGTLTFYAGLLRDGGKYVSQYIVGMTIAMFPWFVNKNSGKQIYYSGMMPTNKNIENFVISKTRVS